MGPIVKLIRQTSSPFPLDHGMGWGPFKKRARELLETIHKRDNIPERQPARWDPRAGLVIDDGGLFILGKIAIHYDHFMNTDVIDI